MYFVFTKSRTDEVSLSEECLFNFQPLFYADFTCKNRWLVFLRIIFILVVARTLFLIFRGGLGL